MPGRSVRTQSARQPQLALYHQSSPTVKHEVRGGIKPVCAGHDTAPHEGHLHPIGPTEGALHVSPYGVKVPFMRDRAGWGRYVRYAREEVRSRPQIGDLEVIEGKMSLP
jgi:hypothetical protein